jgi:glycosyltransferase involved in cell wall biosynthesis
LCRGIFSANLALISKRKKCKIIYDGRGAINAEQIEYGVYNNTGLENKIYNLEKRAVLETDYRISVSNKLLNYWYREFNYKSKDHVVIPSSCSNNYNNKVLDREDLNISENSILVVFSGSISKWHSYSKMISDFTKILNKNPRVNLLFLSKLNSHIATIKNKFPERVFVFWVDPKDVFSYLNIADYGYVVREDSITNQVSSPVKIAEYLSCGLKVLISKNIGDYSEMIEKNDLGYIIENYNTIYLEKVNISEKEKIISFFRSNLALYSDKISQRYLNLINENCSYN